MKDVVSEINTCVSQAPYPRSAMRTRSYLHGASLNFANGAQIQPKFEAIFSQKLPFFTVTTPSEQLVHT